MRRGMTYQECEGETVTRAQARAEIIRHRADWAELVSDLGDRAEYDAMAILTWLGY